MRKKVTRGKKKREGGRKPYLERPNPLQQKTARQERFGSFQLPALFSPLLSFPPSNPPSPFVKHEIRLGEIIDNLPYFVFLFPFSLPRSVGHASKGPHRPNTVARQVDSASRGPSLSLSLRDAFFARAFISTTSHQQASSFFRPHSSRPYFCSKGKEGRGEGEGGREVCPRSQNYI